MNFQIEPISTVTYRAKQALIQELGAVDAMRFLNQFRPGNGDYTQDRIQLQQGKSVKLMVEEIKALRSKKP